MQSYQNKFMIKYKLRFLCINFIQLLSILMDLFQLQVIMYELLESIYNLIYCRHMDGSYSLGHWLVLEKLVIPQ